MLNLVAKARFILLLNAALFQLGCKTAVEKSETQSETKFNSIESLNDIQSSDSVVGMDTSINEIDFISPGKPLDALSHRAMMEAIETRLVHLPFNKSFIDSIRFKGANGVDYPIALEQVIDQHFTYVISRASIPSNVYLKLFVREVNSNSQRLLLERTEWDMTYTNDSLFDVNGDGKLDYVVDWYGTVGCCLKSFSEVYLQKKSSLEFTAPIELINPTFSPKERVVRGVEYGHPGQTEMYKLEWKGDSLIMLEYVSYEKRENGEKTGKVLLVYPEAKQDSIRIKARLNAVPKEYHSIYGYDWFTGECCE